MRIIFLVCTLLLPATAAEAQEQHLPAAPTHDVRATTPAEGGLRLPTPRAHTAAVSPLTAGPSYGPAHLSVPGVSELLQGRRLSVTGAVVGAVVGAAAGVALACLANRDHYGVYCAGQSDTKLVIGGVLGAGLGGWAGAVLAGGRR